MTDYNDPITKAAFSLMESISPLIRAGRIAQMMGGAYFSTLDMRLDLENLIRGVPADRRDEAMAACDTVLRLQRGSYFESLDEIKIDSEEAAAAGCVIMATRHDNPYMSIRDLLLKYQRSQV